MTEDAGEPKPEGALSELIELERRIEGEVAAAEADAARALETARVDTQATAIDSEAAIEDASNSLREAIEREYDAALHAILEQTRADVERYEQADDRKVQELAREVATRLMRTLSP